MRMFWKQVYKSTNPRFLMSVVGRDVDAHDSIMDGFPPLQVVYNMLLNCSTDMSHPLLVFFRAVEVLSCSSFLFRATLFLNYCASLC